MEEDSRAQLSDGENDSERHREQEAERINQRLNKQHPKSRLKQGAKLRETYESIARGITVNEKEEAEKVDESLVKKVSDAILEADSLFSLVRETGDSKQLCNDASVLQSAGRVLLKQINDISVQNTARTLNLSTYAMRMRRYAQEGLECQTRLDRELNPLMIEDEIDNSDDEDLDSRNDESSSSMSKREWAYIGKNLGKLLHNPPTLSYLRPLLKDEDPAPTEHKPKKERRKADDKEARVVVRRREDIEDNSDELAVSKELALVSKALKKAFQRQKKDKIDYYSFVIDPNDFSKTIENMFYVSFLVKDGRTKVLLEDGLPCLMKLSEGEKKYISDNPKSALVSHQSILSFSVHEWKAMKEILQIEEPAIPNTSKSS
ncbi:unnamed protein product [Auanema sp. JU1783]|nr:unnamed protein product [Auanema sp. JU1783]